MCGIVGVIGNQPATGILLEGLKKLEYRGYDSAGVAVLSGGVLNTRKCEGKLVNLENLLQRDPIEGTVGIGHTRWATHGRPVDQNAHPHTDQTGAISVVHNGIIENYLALREQLEAEGHVFRSETDSEVVAHLVGKYYDGDLIKAVRQALREVEGAYAIAVLTSHEPDLIVGARKDSPLVAGLGEGENFLASDVPAILSHTRRVIFLQDGDIAVITREKVQVLDMDLNPLERTVETVDWNPVMAEKGGFEHFMLKEIYEQPQVIRNTVGGRTLEAAGEIVLGELGLTDEELAAINRIYITACGTAYYAGWVGRYLIERFSRTPVSMDLASEFRYMDPIIGPGDLLIVVSQSGETADTLAALREAKRRGAKTLGIVNAKGSTMTREVDGIVYLHAGPEIGVASTKAYMGMLTAFALFALKLAQVKGHLDKATLQKHIRSLKELPQWIEKSLDHAEEIKAIAGRFRHYKDFLFLGRGINTPTAFEGALKLKEISYIHAEAYPSGELKHGPIALIDKDMPILAICTPSEVYEKTVSNVQEVKAREGIVIALAAEDDTEISKHASEVIRVPRAPEWLSPMVNVVPLQLLAYYIAYLRGADVDQPRNLAKAVTVE